jgi:AraC-like DNA-binding protein
LKINDKKLTGVLHHQSNVDRYNLRRYFPNDLLRDLIEQFWFVSWDFKDDESHTQENLPDPNFHLILDSQRVDFQTVNIRKVKLIGPISKSYSYKMEGAGEIIGIKFALGALSAYLESPISQYVDKEIDFQQLVNIDIDSIISMLSGGKNDEQKIDLLHAFITPFIRPPSSELIRVHELVNLIKNNAGITKVEHLSEKSNISIRTVQRCFQQYLGLNPKWLIRKYRLHQALELIEQQNANLLDIVALLGYTDQSHLIRDFKDMIGVTLHNYIHS